jgi:hypothetical protein
MFKEANNGEKFCVGRSGGLKAFKDDLKSGCWKTRNYQYSPSLTPKNMNWFSSEEFCQAVNEFGGS